MDFFDMAFATIRIKVGKCGDFTFVMYDLRMATVAFELVIRHVIFVDEFRGIFCLKYLGFIMTLNATLGRHLPITLNDIEVTLPTGDPLFDISSVIEGIARYVYVPFRLRMTRRTCSHSAREAVLQCLPLALPVKVADKAIRLGHG